MADTDPEIDHVAMKAAVKEVLANSGHAIKLIALRFRKSRLQTSFVDKLTRTSQYHKCQDKCAYPSHRDTGGPN